jgi:hypothetical protein
MRNIVDCSSLLRFWKAGFAPAATDDAEVVPPPWVAALRTRCETPPIEVL